MALGIVEEQLPMIEVNIYFKGHVERVWMNMCNLGKTEVILGMSWL